MKSFPSLIWQSWWKWSTNSWFFCFATRRKTTSWWRTSLTPSEKWSNKPANNPGRAKQYTTIWTSLSLRLMSCSIRESSWRLIPTWFWRGWECASRMEKLPRKVNQSQRLRLREAVEWAVLSRLFSDSPRTRCRRPSIWDDSHLNTCNTLTVSIR